MAVYAKAARGEDEPSALAGLGLIEDGESLTQALQAKSWLAGSLAGLGGALDMADLARDPFVGCLTTPSWSPCATASATPSPHWRSTPSWSSCPLAL